MQTDRMHNEMVSLMDDKEVEADGTKWRLWGMEGGQRGMQCVTRLIPFFVL